LPVATPEKPKRRRNVPTSKGAQQLQRLNRDYTNGRTIAGTGKHYDTWVLTQQLLHHLEPATQALIADDAAGNRVDTNGADRLAQLATLYSHLTPEAIARQYYRFRNGTHRVAAHLAESLLLAVGSSTTEANLHTLPASMAAAEEMVDAWCWATRQKAPKDLAAELLEIAKALSHRPHRQVVCTPLALQVIGGESRYLIAATSPTSGSSMHQSCPQAVPQPEKKSGHTSTTPTRKPKTASTESTSPAGGGSPTTPGGSSSGTGRSRPTGSTASRSQPRPYQTARTTKQARRDAGRKRPTASSVPSKPS
jgi:hypothetical protein